jgi:LAO/AO transport system kinase
MKAGIMEIGDVLVINKADRDGVLRTEKELEALLSFSGRSDWQPPIVKTVAIENKGIVELATAVERCRAFQQSAAGSTDRKRAIARWRILEILRERLVAEVLRAESAPEQLDRLAGEVASKKRDPYSAVEELMKSK